MIDLDNYIPLDDFAVIDLTVRDSICYVIYNSSVEFDPSDLSQYKVVFTYSNN